MFVLLVGVVSLSVLFVLLPLQPLRVDRYCVVVMAHELPSQRVCVCVDSVILPTSAPPPLTRRVECPARLKACAGTRESQMQTSTSLPALGLVHASDCLINNKQDQETATLSCLCSLFPPSFSSDSQRACATIILRGAPACLHRRQPYVKSNALVWE